MHQQIQSRTGQIGGQLVESIGSESHYTLTLRLTLLLLLLHGGSSASMEVPIRVLSGAMLLLPRVLLCATGWWLLAAATVAGNAWQWSIIDNHQFLITYWVLAVALSLHTSEPHEALRRTARALTVLVFAFAVAWKLIAGEYVDGSFLYFSFLTDTRLQRLGAALSGWSLSQTTAIREAIGFMGSRGLTGVELHVAGAAGLKTLTFWLSWMGLLLEGAVAAVYLFDSPRCYLARQYALLAFVLLTYFLVPVIGFAFVLTLIGFAQCADGDTAMKTRYLALLAGIQLTLVPWQSLFLGGL